MTISDSGLLFGTPCIG